MSGSLQIKGNKYYVVARIRDEYGKPKSKWISTGISVQGNNKREAQKVLRRILVELEQSNATYSRETSFLAWVDKWMEQKKFEVRLNTWEGYKLYLEKHIRPYFTLLNLSLSKINAQHIQDYFNLKAREGQSLSTLKKHNAVINGALQEAVKKRIIFYNPIDGVTLPKIDKSFTSTAYTVRQAQTLIELLDTEPLKSAVVLGLFYGLRRSEVCGLRWKDINFDANTMIIRNTVVRMRTLIEHEKTKNKKSKRTLFLIETTIPFLLDIKRKQTETGNLSDHVCTWPDGRPADPSYISHAFKQFLETHDLPIIRFHELRHTTGSLLLEKGLSVKQIQEYLGHENISTTLDIYAHLSLEGKKEVAQAMDNILFLYDR